MDAVYLQNRYRRLFNIRFRNGVNYVSGACLAFAGTADARGFYHSFSPDKKLTLQKLCRTTSPNAVVAALQRGQLKVYLPRGAETVGISLLRTAIRPVLAAIIAHEKNRRDGVLSGLLQRRRQRGGCSRTSPSPDKGSVGNLLV